MIYLLRAPEALCSLCPKDLAKLCQHFDGPLGGFLLLALVLNLPAGLCALSALQDEQVQSCGEANLPLVCQLDLFFAVANISFAIFVKIKVESMASASAELEQPLDSTATRQPRFRRIREGVRHMVLYDCLTCVYIVAFCGSLVWNIFGASSMQPCPVTSSAPAAMVALETAFVFLSLIYMGCSVCFVNCMDFFESIQNQSLQNRRSRSVRTFTGRVGLLVGVVTKIRSMLQGQGSPWGQGHANTAQTTLYQQEAQTMAGAPVVPSSPTVPVPSAPPMDTSVFPVTAGTNDADAKQALAGVAA